MAKQIYIIKRVDHYYEGGLYHSGDEINYVENEDCSTAVFASAEAAQEYIDSVHKNWEMNGYHCANGEAGMPTLSIETHKWDPSNDAWAQDLNPSQAIDHILAGGSVFSPFEDLFA
jgi:hypothetical protein